MPKLDGEGIDASVTRAIPLGLSESRGKSGLTIVTPGKPLKASNDTSFCKTTLSKMVPIAKTRKFSVRTVNWLYQYDDLTLATRYLLVQVNPGLSKMNAAKSVKRPLSVMTRLAVVCRLGTPALPVEQIAGKVISAILLPSQMTSTGSGNSIDASNGPAFKSEPVRATSNP